MKMAHRPFLAGFADAANLNRQIVRGKFHLLCPQTKTHDGNTGAYWLSMLWTIKSHLALRSAALTRPAGKKPCLPDADESACKRHDGIICSPITR